MTLPKDPEMPDFLDIPEAVQGAPWKYARLSTRIANTAQGADLIKRMEAQGIYVEILDYSGPDSDRALLTMPEVPPDAKIRAQFVQEDKT